MGQAEEEDCPGKNKTKALGLKRNSLREPASRSDAFELGGLLSKKKKTQVVAQHQLRKNPGTRRLDVRVWPPSLETRRWLSYCEDKKKIRDEKKTGKVKDGKRKILRPQKATESVSLETAASTRPSQTQDTPASRKQNSRLDARGFPRKAKNLSVGAIGRATPLSVRRGAQAAYRVGLDIGK